MGSANPVPKKGSDQSSSLDDDTITRPNDVSSYLAIDAIDHDHELEELIPMARYCWIWDHCWEMGKGNKFLCRIP